MNLYDLPQDQNSTMPIPALIPRVDNSSGNTADGRDILYRLLLAAGAGGYSVLASPSDSIERVTHIRTLIDFRYALKRPIPVRLRYYGTEAIGIIDEFELHSFGKNEFEVLRELNEDITDLFEELIGMDERNLGKFPKIWKSNFNKYIDRP